MFTCRKAVILAASLAACGCVRLTSQAAALPSQEVNLTRAPHRSHPGMMNAPEFPTGLEWLNTGRPIRLRDLRGKIVLLDFWTYCCINCMHVIPELKQLEQRYPRELVVIGVHSGKFDAERDAANIRSAILRYEIRHPVVNDPDYRIWRSYGVSAWPTLVLIAPDGKIVHVQSGEGVVEVFEPIIAQLIEQFEGNGLDRRPLELQWEQGLDTLLAFPGKVLADATSNRLFVADSNHNRILIATLAGEIEGVVGSGQAGLLDGDQSAAQFDHPQGMALHDGMLYVADTGNHAIRAVDLRRGTVTTLVGTGQQARRLNFAGTGQAVAINSPWDLARGSRGGADMLYVAMAGSHQLWRVDLATLRAEPFAGSGREGRRDGPRIAAWLAQPSGLALDDTGEWLYFADSETSSIRRVGLGSDRVETVVGRDLFEFGDQDGEGEEVRLQHPLGVAWHTSGLYVADTYNNKIKRIIPAKRQSFTFLGNGEPGLRDGWGAQARFDEPGGLSIAGDQLYIADTNNHAIRVANLRTGKVHTLELMGPR